ncbi:Protein kinase-like domain containing protein [Naviculisporaceae sp. PSN 640]
MGCAQVVTSICLLVRGARRSSASQPEPTTRPSPAQPTTRPSTALQTKPNTENSTPGGALLLTTTLTDIPDPELNATPLTPPGSLPLRPTAIPQPKPNPIGYKLRESKLETVIVGRPFIPLDKLDAVLTEDAVKSELSASGLEAANNAALLEYILKHARKIFATLAMIGHVDLIRDISVSGLTDADLPLGTDNDDFQAVRSYHRNADALDMSTKWLVFKNWPVYLIEVFCEFQWRVLAPKIVENGFGRYFHTSCPLPFLPPLGGDEKVIFSNHSRVYKAEIHEAHFQRADGKTGRLQVAIKELHSEWVRGEATSLAKLSKLDHPHLIKSIATYRHRGVYCSIFPWADGGNLFQFWASEDVMPRDASLITWAVQQMAGIANGIVTLHNFSLQENCRHGDLKPQNILHFRKAAKHDLGTLVVSDLGSATFHREETQERGQTTEPGYGTLRYEPPEAYLMKYLPRSRRYDVWSAGCIFLEFLIWLLYRWRGLKLFYEGIDKYWLETSSNHRRGSDGLPVLATVHPKVQEYLRRMRDDPRCLKGGAIGDLLEIVENRLLVPKHVEADPNGVEDSPESQSVFEQVDNETTCSPLEPPIRLPRIVITDPISSPPTVTKGPFAECIHRTLARGY